MHTPPATASSSVPFLVGFPAGACHFGEAHGRMLLSGSKLQSQEEIEMTNFNISQL